MDLNTTIAVLNENLSFIELVSQLFFILTSFLLFGFGALFISLSPLFLKYWTVSINTIATVIETFAIVILVLVTWTYAKSTNELVKIEKEREKNKEKKLLNILLADFKFNLKLLKYHKNELEKKTLVSIEFLGFRVDGWDTFRTQGGLQYIKDSLYEEIAGYYVSQSKLHKEIEGVIYRRNKAAKQALCEEIEEIEECGESLQKEISDLKERRI